VSNSAYRLITLVGGTPDAKVMAFDRTAADEVWRAVSSLDSETGEAYWEQPLEVDYDVTVATPVRRGATGPHKHRRGVRANAPANR
jgi:hypothetical protein